MYVTRVLVSAFELILTVVMSVLVIYTNYWLVSITNPDYDEDEELKKGNLAIAILLAGMLLATGFMVKQGLDPVISMIRLHFMTPQADGLGAGRMFLFAASQMVMVFVVTVLTLSFSLRFYGKLTSRIQEGLELRKGNVAVGVVLCSVVLLVAMYVSDGIGSLSKALIPQPSIGRVQIMR